jgi:hypothetical protein
MLNLTFLFQSLCFRNCKKYLFSPQSWKWWNYFGSYFFSSFNMSSSLRVNYWNGINHSIFFFPNFKIVRQLKKSKTKKCIDDKYGTHPSSKCFIAMDFVIVSLFKHQPACLDRKLPKLIAKVSINCWFFGLFMNYLERFSLFSKLS